MISGLARPTAGEIEMFGCKGKELERIRSRVGCLIEAPGAVWQHECIYKPENKM